MEKQASSPQSIIYGWSRNLAKEAIKQVAESGKLCQEHAYCPLTLRDVGQWFCDTALWWMPHAAG